MLARAMCCLMTVLSLWLGSAMSSAQDAVVGWRGNWTGLWPQTKAPLEWHRIPKGVLAECKSLPGAATNEDVARALPIVNGLVSEWLVIGPIGVADPVKHFDEQQVPDEGALKPREGQRVGEREWKKLVAPFDDPNEFGTAAMPFVDLAKATGGFQPKQVSYAFASIYAPRAGTVRAVVQHSHGMKVWLNGTEIYRSPERQMQMSFYSGFGRAELEHSVARSPRFDMPLQAGWNRVLVKSNTSANGHQEQSFLLRLMERPDVEYDSKNIRWMTELPARSSSTPVLVGERIFVTAEPDELLCLDRVSGKVLWSAFLNYFEALPADERAKPVYHDRIEPLVAKLRTEHDRAKRRELRAEIQKRLLAIDESKFRFSLDGHFESHFGIVGFTVPTPVSDGQRVYVWNGMGIAACFDLDGKRQWMTRVEQGAISYASSPALIDGTFVVFLNRLIGIDAQTGAIKWRQGKVNRNNGAVIPARLSGVPVIVSQRARIVRASDGHVLYRPDEEDGGDTGWAPPTVLGETVYAPKYGVGVINVMDFSGQTGDEWQPKKLVCEMPQSIHHGPNKKWIDRWTAGSPLIHDGLAYQIDIWANAYASDIAAKRMLYQHDTGLRGYFHYNSLRVAASPALIRDRVLLLDNQGTTLVTKPGREFSLERTNRIATVLDQDWSTPGQETIGYAPPIADETSLYLRGERFLYCIRAE